MRCLLIFCLSLIALSGCASEEAKLRRDALDVGSMFGVVTKENESYTFSTHNHGIENKQSSDEFIDHSEKFSVLLDDLTINYYFDESLKTCPAIKNTNADKLKAFIPKSPSLTKGKSHTVNVLLVRGKRFNWQWPYSDTESYFAFPIEPCSEGLSKNLFEITTTMYHELFHIYNDNNFSSKLEEEKMAHAVEYCSYLTSERVKLPKIYYTSKETDIDKMVRIDFPNFDNFSNSSKTSILAQYTVLKQLKKGNDDFGSFTAACKNIYGL